MDKSLTPAALVLGLCLAGGLGFIGHSITATATHLKALDRTVSVKGLAEQEVMANVAIWPVRFAEVDNDLANLYNTVQQKTDKVVAFLKAQGFSDDEITLTLPAIEDRNTQGYADPNIKYRYAARVTVSLYTHQVDKLLQARKQIGALARDGIAIGGNEYESRTEFLFTELNRIKPAMVQQATENAREVAEKFARDSSSSLGKIKNASQGQFIITDRDSNSPHIKNVRIVSTVTYYLTD
ncbi:SIMPL domain-containing protein [Shewanella litorisediminis]|uniref:SIMPL domain-containing protein n=1 Tax=Shewanella litorisediminis TaxID=1173586 RepID=A0ABX7FZL6_9GAMM|nr:SIMPL domain-containing protein [Shewanella litorisediminis]MCL2919505.1 SIMPL domain-containing protein [Shewanella litorisediminis]QRH00456.1 SIMPL domain-containing protein [Shewanella litorisediminis]